MIPPYLKAGDRVAIVSPAGNIDAEYLAGTAERLAAWGLVPETGSFAAGQQGRFAGTAEQRTADLQKALDDRAIKAIICSRGGYGLVQIIDRLDLSRFEIFPKWLIGFSDITVLHNAATALDVATIHGIMARPLAALPADAEPVVCLHDMLFGSLPAYTVAAHPLNRTGTAQGRLTGGNLSVLCSLRGTHFDLDFHQKILFIEDIGEAPYRIDRMMHNLKLSGVLEQLSGLVVGQFSEYEEDPQMNKTVYEIIADAVAEYDYPVCFGFPAGHEEHNLPLMLNADVSLSVSDDGVVLDFN